jgi:hypothetical protein
MLADHMSCFFAGDKKADHSSRSAGYMQARSLAFLLVPIQSINAQSRSVEAIGFKLSLAHTGPGIFFALFGAITVTMLANAQLTVQ